MASNPFPIPPFSRPAGPHAIHGLANVLTEPWLWVTRQHAGPADDWSNPVLIWFGSEQPICDEDGSWLQRYGTYDMWRAREFFEHFGWVPPPHEEKKVVFAAVVLE